MKKYAIINSLLILCVACAAVSCTDMDEYKKISGDKEILYTGKIEQVKVYSGDGRVEVTGVCQSDPKIVNCRIYWNLRKDSVDVPIDMTNSPILVEQQISNLKDQTYNFDIFTYDAAGNRSVPVNAVGRSYGDKYKATISNRLIKSTSKSGTSGIIEWRGLDTTLGPYETEVVYTNTSGVDVTKNVLIEDEKTTLENYKFGTKIKYTTLYLPDEDCLDTFRTATDEVTIN